MTNKETITNLEMIRIAFVDPVTKEQRKIIDDTFDMAIKALEQEQKTGHWIRWYEHKETDWYIEDIPHCKCSECGKEYDTHSSQFIKYCYECGAKMESEDKE